MAGDKYVVRLMKGQCSCGSMANYLNIPEDHGVVFGAEEQPLLNANDHVSGENVIHFGTCSSNANPGNMARNVGMALIPGGFLIKKISEKLGCTGCKCSPKTPLPWLETNEEYALEGAPILTTKSQLACLYGGVISIVDEAQTSSDSSDSEPTEEVVESEPIVQAKSIAHYTSIKQE